ncbi:MAG: GNAT family N-acetyltransferase [Candidatus Heimdallarchaeota archaeon]|nr:GNAT family N-acetyltransferase [Candidatus Heimdallarchaeota archaeon]
MKKKHQSKSVFFELISENNHQSIVDIINSYEYKDFTIFPFYFNRRDFYEIKDVIETLSEFKRGAKKGIWGIYDKKTQQLYGYVDYYYGWDAHEMELNIVIHPDNANKGLGKEVLRYMIRYLFDNYFVNTISGWFDEGNSAAQKLCDSLKFKSSGMMRNYKLVNGEYSGLYCYSILRRNWGKD